MKNTYKLLIVMILSTFTANSQDYDYNLGLKGGVNYDNLTNYNGNYSAGFNFGFFAEYPMVDQTYLLSEFLFSRQGADSKGLTPNLDLTYINWPVLLKMELYKGLYAELGPQFGFLIFAKGGTLAGEHYKWFDVAGSFGLSFDMGKSLNLGLRYNLGLLKINKVGPDKIKNRNLQLSLAVKF